MAASDNTLELHANGSKLVMRERYAEGIASMPSPNSESWALSVVSGAFGTRTADHRSKGLERRVDSVTSDIIWPKPPYAFVNNSHVGYLLWTIRTLICHMLIIREIYGVPLVFDNP